MTLTTTPKFLSPIAQSAPLVTVVAEPVTLVPVPTVLMQELRRQFDEGKQRGYIDPRFESWEVFVIECWKDVALGNPRPWVGE